MQASNQTMGQKNQQQQQKNQKTNPLL